MRKIILNVAVSLDGLIEGPNGEYDWCFTDQDYGMKAFEQRIDAIFYGRKSYDLVRKMSGETAPEMFGNTKNYVFSRKLATVEKGFHLLRDIGEVEAIKREPGKDIFLFGGSDLVTSFINQGLVDEMMLAVHPLILGPGKPLFIDIKGRIPTKLIETKTYDSGLVALRYEVIK